MSAATCRVCGEAYGASDNQERKRDFICGACRYIRDRNYRALRKSKGLRVSGSVMPIEYQRAHHAVYSRREDVKARRRLAAKRRYKNPGERHKITARRYTRTAIESGELTRQPCEVCGELNVDAHHDDYSKPLFVRWLCRQHHRQLHAASARGAK